MPLDDDKGPRKCVHNEGVFCPEHEKMVTSRNMGILITRIIGWGVPTGIVVLLALLSFANSRLDSVEAAVDKHIEKSNDKLDQIHHSVMTLEFNMRKTMGEDFVELKTQEDY